MIHAITTRTTSPSPSAEPRRAGGGSGQAPCAPAPIDAGRVTRLGHRILLPPSTPPPVQRTCGHPSCTDESCTDPSCHRPPTADDVLAGLDPRSEIERTMHTADARFRQQVASHPSEEREHLHGEAVVNRTTRRSAEIRDPTDRAVLAGEPRSGGVHYVRLSQAPAPSAPPLVAGRLQDPRNANLPNERHIYEERTRGAPSYPREAAHMEAMARSSGRSHHEVFEDTVRAMEVSPLATSDPVEQRHLVTTANIVGIAEQRRDPFMGFASAQTLAHAASPGSTATPRGVFGQRQGRVNLPGSLPASGTGATAQFRGFRADVEAGRDPTSEASRRLRRNIWEQHSAMMRSGFDPERAAQLAEEGESRDFISDAMAARMRRTATHRAARATGQMPYNLRSLRYDPTRKSAERMKEHLRVSTQARSKAGRELQKAQRRGLAPAWGGTPPGSAGPSDWGVNHPLHDRPRRDDDEGAV
jgi:hypothetical protein